MAGSIWRKWDLHFHSQTSYDYKDGSVTDQDIIDNLLAKTSQYSYHGHHVIDFPE